VSLSSNTQETLPPYLVPLLGNPTHFLSMKRRRTLSGWPSHPHSYTLQKRKVWFSLSIQNLLYSALGHPPTLDFSRNQSLSTPITCFISSRSSLFIPAHELYDNFLYFFLRKSIFFSECPKTVQGRKMEGNKTFGISYESHLHGIKSNQPIQVDELITSGSPWFNNKKLSESWYLASCRENQSFYKIKKWKY